MIDLLVFFCLAISSGESWKEGVYFCGATLPLPCPTEMGVILSDLTKSKRVVVTVNIHLQ